ncbi:carbon-nitrogen hydrolase family protein [Helicobacter sp. MIT 01-3238]|uniref:carbon-nitrogen hydrolase family protein n=1 Tax=Helicobacter sp. MIT 01-3238 TaxID=398627 RepID=UPI00268ED644
MRILTVALIQMCPKPYALQENLRLALKLAKDSLKKGANLVVFHELFDSGYCVAPHDSDFALDFAKPQKHATFKALSTFAKENAVHIVACGIEKSNKKLYDTAYIIAPSGKCVGKHRKIYLWGKEKSRFSKGKKYEVFKLNFGNFSAKVGLQICYEIGFGVGANILALQGAEILIYPSAFGAARAYNWDLLSRARAIENSCFVLACNHSGIENAESSALNSSLDTPFALGGNFGEQQTQKSSFIPKISSKYKTSTAIRRICERSEAINTRICDSKNIDSAKGAESSTQFAESTTFCHTERSEVSQKNNRDSSPTAQNDNLMKLAESIEFAGDSRIISPKGTIIKKATKLNEAIITQINLDEIYSQREAIPYLKDFDTKLTKRSFGKST